MPESRCKPNHEQQKVCYPYKNVNDYRKGHEQGSSHTVLPSTMLAKL